MLESLFNKVVGLKACNFIKRRLQHKCFPVKFAKCLRVPFLQNLFSRVPFFCKTANFFGSLLLWTAREYQKYWIWMVQMVKNSENFCYLKKLFPDAQKLQSHIYEIWMKLRSSIFFKKNIVTTGAFMK